METLKEIPGKYVFAEFVSAVLKLEIRILLAACHVIQA